MTELEKLKAENDRLRAEIQTFKHNKNEKNKEICSTCFRYQKKGCTLKHSYLTKPGCNDWYCIKPDEEAI